MSLFHHVEDSEKLCEIFSKVMNLFGHEIVSFSNGLKYIEHMDSAEYICPIAIFTDIDMPIMNGFEMIEETIRHYPNRLIVILSSHRHRPYVNEAHIFQYVDKPYYPESLKKLASTLITKKLSLGLNADLLNALECPGYVKTKNHY